MSQNSVTLWIQAMRAGDEAAARELWARYFSQLMHMARSRMTTLPRAVYDEEDAAISTFRVLCSTLQEGRYPDVADRDELWNLMLKILIRKVNRRAEYEATEKRSASRSTTEVTELPAADDHVMTAMVADECESLFRLLKDASLEQLVLLKLEGFTNDEIARKLNRTRRTVQRMLTLIRDIWLKTADDGTP